MTFAERLKRARRHAKLSQAELAAACCLRQSTISELETNGEGSAQSVCLARVCGVSATWLAEGIGDMIARDFTTNDQALIHICQQLEGAAPYLKEAAREAVANIMRLASQTRADDAERK